MKKILLIDDDQAQLTITKSIIEKNFNDFAVFTSLSGLDGFELAKKEIPDTILLDIVMPKTDGYAVCKMLKANKKTQSIPVIMMTGVEKSTESRAKGLEIGADAFLYKPIDPIEITAQIKVMLRIKEAEHKLRAEKDNLEVKIAESTFELKKSEAKFRSLFLSANDSIFLMKGGKFIDCNPKTLKLFKCKEEDIIGHSPEEFSPKYQEDGSLSSESANQKINAAIQGKPQFFKWIHKQKNGTTFDAEVSLNKLIISDEVYIQAIVRDTTEQIRKEKEQTLLYNISNAVNLTQNLEKLIEIIQEELGKIIDTTNFFIALYDEKTESISLPYHKDKKNNSSSFPIGKTLSAYVINTKKSLFGTKDTFRKLEELGEIDNPGEYPEIWIGVPLKVEQKVIGILVVQSYTDALAYTIADVKMLEFVSDQISISVNRSKTLSNLKIALEKATESDRLKSAFLATMSHELRTPLNAVIGFSEMISADLPLDDIVEFSQIIHNSGNQLLHIIEDIFDITLIEAGNVEIVFEEVELKPIMDKINESIKIEQHRLTKNDLTVNYTNAGNNEEIILNTDPSKLKQILINLTKNAIKFTEKGTVNYGYTIIKSKGKPLLRFYVEDTGIGISEENLTMIFDMFRQVEYSNTREFGGVGIGLSIAKKMVELLGGELWVDSTLGKGSTFYFTLPNALIYQKKDPVLF